MVIQAKVLNLHWEHSVLGQAGPQEATLEVEHENGDRQMFVVPILRMTERIPAKPTKWHNKSEDLA